MGKTTTARAVVGASFSVFETDGFKKETFDLNKIDFDAQIIIIGGKYYRRLWKRIYMIWKLLQHERRTVVWFF